MDYYYNVRKKIIIIAIVIVIFIVMMAISYNLLKREDTKHTSYTCEKLVPFSDKVLLSDKKVDVSSATSMEESLSPVSFMFSTLASFTKVTRLVDESNTWIELAKLKKSDQNTHSLLIPKNACYVTLIPPEFHRFQQLNSSNSVPQGNLEVYKWVKHYSNYFSQKFQTTHTVVIMNNSALHIQINSSPSNTISPFSIFSEIKAKITVHNLDKDLSNHTFEPQIRLLARGKQRITPMIKVRRHFGDMVE